MLLHSGLHASLVKIHRSIQFAPAFPYAWDDKTRRVHIIREQQLWKLWLIIILGLLIINCYALREYINQWDFVNANTQVSSILALSVVSIVQWFLCDRAESSAKFLNGMLDMEAEIGRKGFVVQEMKIPKLICEILVHIEAITPIFVGIGSGLMPCSPPNLIVPLNPSCSHTGKKILDSKSILSKCIEFILLSTLNGIFWKAALGIGTAWTIHILVGCQSQCLALKKLERYPGFNGRIQLLNIMFNEVYVGTVFVVVAGCSCALTAFAYALLQIYISPSDFPVPVIIWFLLMLVDSSIVLLYISKIAGSVFSISKDMLQKQHSALSASARGRLQRRVLNSWKPIKVSFGLCNFIDDKTPLKLLEFSVARFVDLILMD
ncbi:unnamed protein product [Orchesella dallaii]|uniref:Gustatory receptor n=1 Tax=Orchesella dallaii TaxID=48710 RepID=A0ABP1QYQ9_9HEXA